MIDLIKKVFGKQEEAGLEDTGHADDVETHDVRIATCALFLEMANIDGEFTDLELKAVVSILRDEYDLTEEHATEITRQAGKELEESLDLWSFTNMINENYSEDEKIHVVELLWKIVFVDGKLDKHEDYLVRKLARLLRLPHKKLIEAKLRVLEDENE